MSPGTEFSRPSWPGWPGEAAVEGFVTQEQVMAKLIMIVDDSASLRQVVGIALKGAGYRVLEACDGRDALSKLTGEKVHLIVSDVNMPNMDGISMVREIKKLPDYRFTPIMMLTTESDMSKKTAGKEAGAKAWLVKPFQPPMLLDAVSKLVLP
jgi:two-component system chemotaxis response regulator CheY